MSEEPKALTPPVVPRLKPTAPAMHGDRLWETPSSASGRFIENLDSEPVWVETKTQYFKELNKRGLRMKAQQESTTGPEREIPVPIPLAYQPTPPPDPITMGEAHVFGAMRAFLLKHGITEATFCDRCDTRKREAGCNVVVHGRRVANTCRCGTAEYRSPVGTTDMILERLANLTYTANDRVGGIISMPIGDRLTPTTMLAAQEGTLLQQYFTILQRRELQPRWFCRACWDSRSLSEDDAMGLHVGPHNIHIVCPKYCRMLCWASGVAQ